MVISFCFLALTFFFTLIIYSSLYSHDSLYNKHYKVLKAKMGNGVTRVADQGCSDELTQDFKDVDSIRNYHSDEHSADFLFCLLIGIACVVTFFFWVFVFTSRGKQGVCVLTLLIFCTFVLILVYFIYFNCEGEDNIDSLKRIKSNIELILNSKCYEQDITSEVSINYMLGYIKSIVYIVRTFVILNFVTSIICFVGLGVLVQDPESRLLIR